MKRALIDLTGKVFGRWFVLNRADNDPWGQAMWACRCQCGNVSNITGYSLRKGLTKSCTCLKLELLVNRVRTHGCRKTPEYNVWCLMRRRCQDPECLDWINYGGRGIKVCQRWEDFAYFLMDAGPRPTSRHTIDRIDNKGDYEPGNCHWTTRIAQNRNTRRNALITFNGETRCAAEWCELLGIPKGRLERRLKSGWPIDRALTAAKTTYPTLPPELQRKRELGKERMRKRRVAQKATS